MARVAVIGERATVQGFALAGAIPFVAQGPQEVSRAWHALPDDVAVVILTPAAAGIIDSFASGGRSRPLLVVMPP